jgi:hypothetical protein
MRKIKITNLPKAAYGGPMNPYNQMAPTYLPDTLSRKPTEESGTLSAVPRDRANLEAEGGETALVLDVGGLPNFYDIRGKRHSEGGVPLNLPEDAFIFSDTSSMKIKDKDFLKDFNVTYKRGGHTPADVSRKYDISKFRKILSDPDETKIAKATAENMISNYMQKLSKLALYQEAMKGFPDGIPKVAVPYMQMNAVNPMDMLPLKGQPNEEMDERMQETANPSQQQVEQMETNPIQAYGGAIADKIKDNPLLQKVYKKLGGAKRRFQPETGIYMVMKNGGPVFYDGNGTEADEENNNIILPIIFQKGGAAESTAATGKIPENLIKNVDDPDLKIGDYFRDKEGKVRKVSKLYSQDKVKPTKSGKDFYTPKFGSLEDDVRKAEEIMKGLEAKGLASKGKNGWTVYRGAKDALDIAEKELITSLASYNKDDSGKSLGAPGFNIASQSSYTDKNRTKKADDGFFGFVDPEMVEYRFWQAMNPNVPAEQFKSLDAAAKLDNRTKMLGFYGYTPEEIKKLGDKVNDPAKLYTKDFISDKKTGLVKRNQDRFESAGYRTQLGDDFKFGLEHVDKYEFQRSPEGEIVVGKETDDKPEGPGDIVPTDLEVGETSKDIGPEWWLQDAIRTFGAAGDMARIKKYMPWVPKVTPYMPSPTFYDPTRELAANAEQAAIAAQASTAYSPGTASSARLSQIQGTAARQAADTLGRYNNLNVGTANEFEAKKADVFNQTNLANAELTKEYFDKVTMANQQYDNSKSQTRQELRSAYIDAITNKEQTYAMNQLYPNYQVDPSMGGRLRFIKGEELTPMEQSAGKIEQFQKIKGMLPGVDDNTILKLMGSTPEDDFSAQYLKMMQGMTPAGLGQYYQES